jgi:hypothetical protein
MSDVDQGISDAGPADAGAAKKIKVKSFLMKDGEFSKTATFASVTNTLVLLAYVMSWFAGSSLGVEGVGVLMLPQFDVSAAIALLTVMNGTYLGNNMIKSKDVA